MDMGAAFIIAADEAPWSPLAGLLGFTSLPLPFMLFLVLSTLSYLGLVELAKRKFALFRQSEVRRAGSLA